MQGNGKVFISHSHEDNDLVTRLKSALMAAGIAVWIDHEQLKSDTLDWQEAVRKGILQAPTVIYVASPTAARSPYVIHEIEMARGEGKPIINFWIRGEKWYDCVPMGWILAQYTDGRSAAYAQGLEKLLAALTANVDSSDVADSHPAATSDNDDDAPYLAYGGSVRALPIYLLLDCSADMAGGPIEALREGMQMLYDELMSDQEIRSKAKLSVITFGGGAEQTALVRLRSFEPPPLRAFGTRALGAALHLLSESITSDIVLTTMERRGDYAPIVFIFLGGRVEDDWRSEAKLLRELDSNASPQLIGLGVGPDADTETLASICGAVLHIATVSGPELRAFLKFVSGSVPNSSKPRHKGGGRLLPPVPPGFTYNPFES